MFSLSTYYEQAVRVWLRENPRKVVTIHNIGKFLGESYLKAENIQVVFQASRNQVFGHMIHLGFIKKIYRRHFAGTRERNSLL